MAAANCIAQVSSRGNQGAGNNGAPTAPTNGIKKASDASYWENAQVLPGLLTRILPGWPNSFSNDQHP